MKFYKIIAIICLILFMSVTVFAKKGPNVDKIYFDVRMKESIGIQDVAKGKTDIFFQGLQGTYIKGLNQETLDELDLYTVPSGTWSLNLNPIPNQAPYTWKVDGEEYFNPFAIEKVRYALNWLINRQYIVDEILGGAGGPMFTMATPGQPGTYKYNLVASRQGMTPEGDQEKALKMIAGAMKKAAQLPSNQGRLKKEGKWWTFDGKPVTIKFLIRVDDPEGRLKEGEYIAQQIEKAGIKVDKKYWDRVKCIKTAYYSDPAEYKWNMYTEGWGAGATRKFWEHIVSQMYAPWYGYMPGGADQSNWNYKNKKLDKLTKKAYRGNVLTEKEYWDTILNAVDLALKDSVRIYVAYQNQYFAANKDRFEQRMAYGLGDGLNEWSLVTANTKNNVLRSTQYSAKGGLFMSAWNPVGTDGFSDTYSLAIASPLYDQGYVEHPATAEPTEYRTEVIDSDTKVHKEDGKVVGEIKVPTDAVEYDSKKDKWVKVDPDKTAMSKAKYEFRFSNYHHGIPMSIVDYMYASAFVEEWKNKDSEDDPYYDEQYSSYMSGGDIGVGTVYDLEKETITTYFDYNFPASQKRVAMQGSPGHSVSATPGVGVTWEVVEALARMVVDGGASGTKYSFSSSIEGTEEVDVLRSSCVKDIKAELQEMIKEGYVPNSIKEYITVEAAKKRYKAAIEFIKKHGNAYISNGPFYLAKYDPKANYAELKAFRDDSYPFKSGYWRNKFKSTRLVIDELETPMMTAKGIGINVKANVSAINYPENKSIPAKKGTVKLLLVTDEEEIEFKTKKVEPGLFKGKIPARVTKDLESGSYTILAIASTGDSVPVSKTQTIIIH